MSEKIVTGFKCPICGIGSVLFDVENWTFVCENCGGVFSRAPGTTAYPGVPEATPEAAISGGTIEVGHKYVKTRLPSSVLPHEHKEISEMRKDILEIKRTINQMRAEGIPPGVVPKIVVVEEMPREEAKGKIEAYMKEHEAADIEELMTNLGIELRILVDILDELKKEGKIAEQD